MAFKHCDITSSYRQNTIYCCNPLTDNSKAAHSFIYSFNTTNNYSNVHHLANRLYIGWHSISPAPGPWPSSPLPSPVILLLQVREEMKRWRVTSRETDEWKEDVRLSLLSLPVRTSSLPSSSASSGLNSPQIRISNTIDWLKKGQFSSSVLSQNITFGFIRF